MRLFPERQIVVALTWAPALVVHDLEAALDRTAFEHLFHERLVGDASDERIRIQRVRSLWRTIFAPRFVGAVRRDGRAIEGVFRLPLYTRGFLVGGAAFLLAEFVRIVLAAVARGGLGAPRGELLALILELLLFGGWLIPKLAWWMGRADIARIEAAIREVSGHVGA
jgi:hypothetical protein